LVGPLRTAVPYFFGSPLQADSRQVGLIFSAKPKKLKLRLYFFQHSTENHTLFKKQDYFVNRFEFKLVFFVSAVVLLD